MPRNDKRKRLPYAVNGLLDEGLMANAEALRALVPILERELDRQEHDRRIGRAVHEIHKNDKALREIKSIQQEGRD